MRHDGKLWIFADGRAMRGVYDANGRLERFDDDTPPVFEDITGIRLGIQQI